MNSVMAQRFNRSSSVISIIDTSDSGVEERTALPRITGRCSARYSPRLRWAWPHFVEHLLDSGGVLCGNSAAIARRFGENAGSGRWHEGPPAPQRALDRSPAAARTASPWRRRVDEAQHIRSRRRARSRAPAAHPEIANAARRPFWKRTPELVVFSHWLEADCTLIPPRHMPWISPRSTPPRHIVGRRIAGDRLQIRAGATASTRGASGVRARAGAPTANRRRGADRLLEGRYAASVRTMPTFGSSTICKPVELPQSKSHASRQQLFSTCPVKEAGPCRPSRRH